MKMAMEYLRNNARMAADEVKNIQEEETSDEDVLAKWETLLPDYPKWNCGGTDFSFEEYDADGKKGVMFCLDGCEAYVLAYKTLDHSWRIPAEI